MAEQEKIKPQKKKGISGKTVFTLTIIFVLLFFLSPLPEIMVGLIPQSAVRKVLSPLYQEIILEDKTHALKEPRKYEGKTPLSILSHNTGICFSFYSTPQKADSNIISAKILKDARRGRGIAEVIAVDKNKREHQLKKVDITERNADEDNEEPTSIICHTFGNYISTLPEAITAIYVRPYDPITPHKVTWFTIKDIR